MPKNKNIALVIIILLIIASIIIIQNPLKQSSVEIKAGEGINTGQKAPDFALQDLDGVVVRLSDFKGKAVVLNFWATWCPPCREEMPVFEEIFIKNKDKLEILGINLQESRRSINNFLKEIPVTYTLLLDPDGDVKRTYNVFTQPVTYFIDENGVIVDKKFGPLTEQEIGEKFAKLKIE